MKINFGGVKGEKESFLTAGLDKQADYNINLDNYPLPFKDNSVDEIWASHILEHLKEPLDFLEECYRIMKSKSIMTIKVPHCEALGGSNGSMEHRWSWHEYAIRTVTSLHTSIFPHKFEHISTKVKYGRFMFWQKREIKWIISKP